MSAPASALKKPRNTLWAADLNDRFNRPEVYT
jgi:hypothetical protein